MGNKLYVDTKVSQIDEILDFNMENLKNEELENEKSGHQNLKVWRFYENEEDQIQSEGIILPNIKEDQFSLSSLEAYVILLVYKGKDDISEISAFPTTLWGIVESSSNMTPRGLKYAFSTSGDKSENLESYLLSKRDFKDSDFKYVLFIWNGKNCSPVLKSRVLMKAFDLDKKLSTPTIMPYLYHGDWIKDSQFQKGKTVKLNEIINNTHENITDDNLLPLSSETFFNYHETVYLLKWLYPLNDKKTEKKSPSKSHKRFLFNKVNKNFLNSGVQKNYYDLFIPLEKPPVSGTQRKKQEVDEDEEEEEDFKVESNSIEESENLSNDSLNSLNEINDEDEDMDLINDIKFSNASKRGITNLGVIGTKLSLGNINSNYENINETNKLKINLGDIHSKAYSSTDTDNNSNKTKGVLVPKLNMKFQHKVLNDEIISQRTKQISEDEEKLDTLTSNTIRKASDIILQKDSLFLKKLDLKNLTNNSISNVSSNSKRGSYSVNTLNLNMNNLQDLKNLELKYNIKKNLDDNMNLDIYDYDEDYDLKESERKKLVMDYFSKTMSQILDGFLFLSSYNVAKNKDIVNENKITHIINSAADVCQNHFEDNITYLSFNLKDHAMENIECLFYEVIHFIESAREKGGKVLVHCIQGISRSVTLVIAYLIFLKKINYDEAFRIVQAKRSIASPNLGFSIQLQNFYQRLCEPPHTFRLIPKIFATGSFQAEQPEKIVCRLTQEQFFEQRYNNTIRVFDKRGVYIVVTLECIYLWIGSKVYEKVKKQNYITNLQKFENAPNEVNEIKEGSETEEFFKIWFDSKEKFKNFNLNRFSEIIYECDNWYKDIDITERIKEKLIKKKLDIEMCKDNNSETKYPEEDNPENLIDLDDLTDEDYFVACLEDKNENKFNIFIWKGSSVQVEQDQSSKYLDKIKNIFFSKDDYNKIVTIEEITYNESDEFMSIL